MSKWKLIRSNKKPTFESASYFKMKKRIQLLKCISVEVSQLGLEP